ncbi:MAG TPA: hypothetical protein VGJ20_38385 [Xanthobacteraceae bacterium]|jgi:hypothetical protein
MSLIVSIIIILLPSLARLPVPPGPGGKLLARLFIVGFVLRAA